MPVSVRPRSWMYKWTLMMMRLRHQKIPGRPEDLGLSFASLNPRAAGFDPFAASADGVDDVDLYN
ncbi:hypothetical protein Hanom_Chr14g01275581 [Helianthus anomalus]